jgi:plasmid stabilization system protein ParE
MKFPRRFPILTRAGRGEVRKCTHGNYLIFYRIEPDLIRALHILHGAVDYGPLLEGL